jgi:glycosyltransferase involved in cell wall biosynthesis
LNKHILLIGVSSDAGGGTKHLFSLIRFLLSKDFKVSLIIPNNGPLFQDFESLGINLFDIDTRKLSLKSLSRIIFILKQLSPDLIHTHGKGAGIYGRLSNLFWGSKSIHTFHGFYLGNEKRFRKFILLVVELTLKYFSDRLIAVSKGELNYLIKKGISNHSNTKLIYNGVDEKEFAEAKSDQQSSRPVIGTLSRIDYAKGIDLLIKTVFEFEKRGIDAEFHLLGGTPNGFEKYHQEILEFTKKSNWVSDRIFFHGEHQNPSAHLRKFDIYLCTSRREGFPLALLEAALCHKLIVSTNVCGCNEIVEDGVTGFLATNLSPESIADALARAISSNKKQQIIDNCFQKVSHEFSQSRMLEKTSNLYIQLLQNVKADRI